MNRCRWSRKYGDLKQLTHAKLGLFTRFISQSPEALALFIEDHVVVEEGLTWLQNKECINWTYSLTDQTAKPISRVNSRQVLSIANFSSTLLTLVQGHKDYPRTLCESN